MDLIQANVFVIKNDAGKS